MQDLLETRHSRLEEEVERLGKELSERGEEALRESREHETVITRSMEERKRLQVRVVVAISKMRGQSII